MKSPAKTKPLKLRSNFAILDVLGSCKKLERHLARDGAIPVTIHGHIIMAWGDNDGVSTEYEMIIDEIEVMP